MKGVIDGGETQQTRPSKMGLTQTSAPVEKDINLQISQVAHAFLLSPRACFASNLSQKEASLETGRPCLAGLWLCPAGGAMTQDSWGP